MGTFRKAWVTGLASIALAVGLASIVHGQDNQQGRVLPDGCRVNVAINTGRGFPASAIETVVNHGGTVLVTPVGDEANPGLTVQLTVTGWTMYEDGDWGDLRDYEVECATPTPTPTTVIALPIVTR